MDATALAAFLLRALATAGVVIGVSVAVARLGPRRGGAIAGLPMVIGPGLLVLALSKTDAFVAQAAAAALAGLAATQAFALAYAAAATAGARPSAALAAAVAAWACSALLVHALAPGPLAGLALFVAATLVVRLVGRRLLRPDAGGGGAQTPGDLLLRGALAGLLVGAVAALAGLLGPSLAGVLVAYPVGLTVIAAAIHARSGAARTAATLHAAALGAASLAAFALSVALLAEPIGAPGALAIGLAASLATTAALLRAARSSS